MFPDQLTQLLTAFVDGELSQREREAVMRLLHGSSEAREMLRQLQENAHKLKQLPRHKVEPSLVDEVMQAIAEIPAQPKQLALRSARRRWVPYLAASLAASLLIAALSILYWKTMVEPNPVTKDAQNIAKGDIPEKKPDPAPRKPNPMLAQMIAGTFGEFSKAPPVDGVTARFSELEGGTRSAEFAHELKREKAVKLDITVKSNSIAMGRLKNVLGHRGIILVADPSAAKALEDKNQAKAEYLVYAESLNSDEVAKLMNELAESYVVGEGNNQRKVSSPYEEVTVTPIGEEGDQKVAKLLGVATLEQVRKDTKPQAKRLAVVLPTAPATQSSPEVRDFVTQRRPQPGALRVLIRIHEEK